MITKETVDGVTYWKDQGTICSIQPTSSAATFYFPLMVPPSYISHQSILLLGVCGNTIGTMISEQYPDSKQFLVDCQQQEGYPVDYEGDAYVYLADICSQVFDYTVADISVGNQQSSTLLKENFLESLSQHTRYAKINIATDQADDFHYSPFFELISTEVVGNNLVIFLRSLNADPASIGV